MMALKKKKGGVNYMIIVMFELDGADFIEFYDEELEHIAHSDVFYEEN